LPTSRTLEVYQINKISVANVVMIRNQTFNTSLHFHDLVDTI